MTAAEVAAAYRIPPDLMAAVGWQDADDYAVREALGYHAHRGADLGGILMPLRQPRTGEVLGHICRVAHPPTGGPRYLQPPGCRWLYMPPVPEDWLDDPTAPAVVVEGPKSALALRALAQRHGRRLVAIATCGAWSWRRTVDHERKADGTLAGVTGPSPSLDWLAWQGRDAVVALDGDARTNPQVRAAVRALAHDLAGRGAAVRVATIPPEAGAKAGPDDVLAACGDDAALGMLDAARAWAECALAAAEEAIAALEADRKLDPLPVIEAISAVGDPARRGLLVGQLAALKIAGVTKAMIEAECARHFAQAEAQRAAAAEAARRGKLLGLRVDGAALLDDLAAFVRRFMRMTEAQLVAMTLAVINTHVFRAAMYCPVIHVTAPEKACGKSRLLEVARLFVWRPWMTGRTTAANLQARCAEGCTLLLDEADAALEQDREYVAALRAILDCRYEADKPASIRSPAPGGGWESKDLDVYGPTFIGGIGHLPDTVASRAIPIVLRRQSRADRAEKFRKRKVQAEARALRERIEAWCAKNYDSLVGAEPPLPDMRDRQEDFSEPLLAIADAAGGEWSARARRALVELCTGAAAVDDSIGAKLLADVRGIFDGRQADRIASKDLAEALGEMEDRPWAEWGRAQKPITPPQVARQLGRFAIAPRTIRDGGATAKGYLRADFGDAWGRYLAPDDPLAPNSPISNRHSVTTRVNIGENRDFGNVTDPSCDGTKNGVSANKDAGCDGVTVQKAQTGHGARVTPPDGAEPLGAAYARARQAGLFGEAKPDAPAPARHCDL